MQVRGVQVYISSKDIGDTGGKSTLLRGKAVTEKHLLFIAWYRPLPVRMGMIPL